LVSNILSPMISFMASVARMSSDPPELSESRFGVGARHDAAALPGAAGQYPPMLPGHALSADESVHTSHGTVPGLTPFLDREVR
jgi:hypothetical protein